MDKSQVLPNRKEARVMMRKFKHLRGLKRRRTKGAFGALPEYMRESKKKEAERKANKLKHVETKEVTKDNAQPVENKEVKEKNE